jgi:hypothetical protein
MQNHVLRPLIVVIVIIALVLTARVILVPADFGIHERGYTYGWHRKSNEQKWRSAKVLAATGIQVACFLHGYAGFIYCNTMLTSGACH